MVGTGPPRGRPHLCAGTAASWPSPRSLAVSTRAEAFYLLTGGAGRVAGHLPKIIFLLSSSKTHSIHSCHF